jgi:outer membrane protein TolC
MGKWLSDQEKQELVKAAEGRFRNGTIGRDDVLRAKMDLDMT